MMWDVLTVEPAHAVCDQCGKHDCGIVDGEHKWIRTGIQDRYGDPIIIGYKCVELYAQNLGMTKEIIEKEIPVPPTDEQIERVVVSIKDMLSGLIFGDPEPMPDDDTAYGDYEDIVGRMSKDELKAFLKENEVKFFNGADEETLRKLVLDHVHKRTGESA